MPSIRELQTLVSQYVRGYNDAQPTETRQPAPNPTGPYLPVYLEGYQDGLKNHNRSQLASETLFPCILNTPCDTPDIRALVSYLRGETAKIDQLVGTPSEVYRLQGQAGARYIDAEPERQRAQLKKEL